MSAPQEWRRVYLASPIPTYWTRRYERHLERLCGLAPAAEIVEPRQSGWDNAAWLREGRDVIATCDALVAFGLAGGVIGRGVWQELRAFRRITWSQLARLQRRRGPHGVVPLPMKLVGRDRNR
ncbi:MAG: hypothetical protein ACYDHB_00950, partial [Candidatus Dormibacteria bacterium]